jgi:hypothetical protein
MEVCGPARLPTSFDLRGAGSTHSPLDVSARVLHAGRRADLASLASFDLARSIREVIEPTHL